MSKPIQAIRGMSDVLPAEISRWQLIEHTFGALMAGYGYDEIRMPIVELTDLFKRSIGEVTDIVEKEMYTFTDRNGDSLSLRPEGTAGCVRAAIQNGLLHNQTQKLWYAGPMFRHERPQKGRYRQFHQLGVEVFGMEGPDIDAEIIMLTARFWKQLALDGKMTLQLNSLGSSEARQAYRSKLVAYFSARQDQLDEDSQRRLHSNPLRILDSKNPAMRELIDAAPKLNEYLDESSHTHFRQLCDMLDEVGIRYEVNPCLVRGLDYYNRTVFEWVTTELGAQGTVCAGGRYDGLVEQLGGKATPAVGFALGMERLVALLDEDFVSAAQTKPHVYFLIQGDAAERAGRRLAEQLRDALPDMRMIVHAGGGSLKSQMKKADKSGAQLAMILADDELRQTCVTVKYLREQREQQTVQQTELAGRLAEILNRN